MWLKNYFGKRGFKRPQKVISKHKTINVGQLKFKEQEVNLEEKGFDNTSNGIS